MLRLLVEDLQWRRPLPLGELTSAIARAARLADPGDLDTVAELARRNAVFDERLAYPALAALPAWGEAGLSLLACHVVEGPHGVGAVSVLTSVALGRAPECDDTPFLREGWAAVPRYAIASTTRDAARRTLRRLMLESRTDSSLQSHLLELIASQHRHAAADPTEKLRFLLDLLLESQLVLNEGMLREFEALLDTGVAREEELHRFLVAHPVLLDPLATELRTKHELGSDFITDFVVRRVNDEYVVVEIERSTDPLFRADGAPSTALAAAMAQVRDFQSWLSDNLAYAQRKLPNLRRPDGLVVIGRRTGLSTMDGRRLEEENFQRRVNMRIVTFDDLLAQAGTIYRNMLYRPPVLWTRDQRVI